MENNKERQCMMHTSRPLNQGSYVTTIVSTTPSQLSQITNGAHTVASTFSDNGKPSSSISNNHSINDATLTMNGKKGYQDPSSKHQMAKIQFERKVKRYFYQLTKGCGDKTCSYRLCTSCPQGPRVTTDAASVMSIQLASKPKSLFCPRLPAEADAISLSPFGTPRGTPSSSPKMSRNNSSQDFTSLQSIENDVFSKESTGEIAENAKPHSMQRKKTQPFLHTFLSSSPFASLFAVDDQHTVIDPSAEILEDAHNYIHSYENSRDVKTDRNDTNVPSRNIVCLSALQRKQSFIETTSRSFDHVISKSMSMHQALFRPNKTIPQSHSIQDLPKLQDELLDLSNPQLNVNSVDQITESMDVKMLTDIVSRLRALPVSERDTDPTYFLLLKNIRDGFSSIIALKNGFRDDSTYPQHPSKLDITGIRAFYNAIMSVDPTEPIRGAFIDSLEILLAKLFLHLPQYQTEDGNYLRVLLILLENPVIMSDTSDGDILLKKLALFIGSLKTKPRRVLTAWLSKYDENGFTRILRHFQDYLCRHYSASTKIEESVIAATRVLSILNTANDYLRDSSIIPYTEFYVPQLYEKLNFKEHHKIWSRSRESYPIKEFAFFNYPFLFDPISKTRIMHIHAMLQMAQEYEDAFVNQSLLSQAQKFLRDAPQSSALIEKGMKQATNPYLVLEIRREHLVEDVLDQIQAKQNDLKKPLKIRFVGGGEEGLDQGGVQKEFFQILISSLLDPSYGLFIYDEETRQSWFNRFSLESERQFELVGMVLGLALYNGVILDVQFPTVLYKKLLDLPIEFLDLKHAFPALGNGLQQLLDWSDGDVADIFLRNFEISYDVYGTIKTIPLVENGENIPVTNENRIEYVQLYTQHFCNESVKIPFAGFRRGFYLICGGDVLSLCRPEELELLICGSKTTELDFNALELAAQYDDGYNPTCQVIRWFWSIVHDMPIQQKKKLLSFVTASDRIPLKGLGNLTFVIQRNGPDSDRLPTALTCFGRLLLPEYSNFEKLRDRLITAIENAKGFGLV